MQNKNILPFSSPVNYAYINGQINRGNRVLRNDEEIRRPHSCLEHRPTRSGNPSPAPTHHVSIKVQDDEVLQDEYVEHVYVNINSRKEMENFLRFCDERIEKVMNVKPKFELHFPDPSAT